jgi:hypothetical protein
MSIVHGSAISTEWSVLVLVLLMLTSQGRLMWPQVPAWADSFAPVCPWSVPRFTEAVLRRRPSAPGAHRSAASGLAQRVAIAATVRDPAGL